jgi:hypothetical protein
VSRALSGTSATFSGLVTGQTTSNGNITQNFLAYNSGTSIAGASYDFQSGGTSQTARISANYEASLPDRMAMRFLVGQGSGLVEILKLFNSIMTVTGAATFSGNVGIGTTSPSLKTEIMGVAGFPASSGTSQTGITRFSQTSGQGVMDVFQNGSAGAGFQVTNSSNLSLSYPFIINPNGGNVLIGTTSDNGAKLQVSGAATFSSGIGIGGATATTGGIQFPATQVAIANANNLDDYEEGTWTPTATFSGGNGDLSYTVQAGSYVKVGRLVTCMGYLLFSETTASGNLTIGGLPFTAGYTPTSTLIRFGIGVDNLTGLSGMPTGEIGNGATSIGMSYTGTGTATSISNSNTGGNAVFRMNFSYTV